MYWRNELAAIMDGAGGDASVSIAEVAGEPAGYSAVSDVPGESRTGWVQALYVRADRFDRGIGSTLLDIAVAHCRDRGKTAVTLWVLEGNLPARAFYERRGFRPTGRRQVIHIGAPVPELHYARTLSPAVAFRRPTPDHGMPASIPRPHST